MPVRCEAYVPGKNAWKLVREIPDGHNMNITLLPPRKERTYKVEAGDGVAEIFRLPDGSSIPSGSGNSDKKTRVQVLPEGLSFRIGNYRLTSIKKG